VENEERQNPSPAKFKTNVEGGKVTGNIRGAAKIARQDF